MGAAGALEASIAAMAVIEDTLPATRNLAEVDPACAGIDHIMGPSRRADVGVAISCSFGLGGHNSCLVLGTPEGR
jgi:3-oxoacyl-(acyl-carrier-protein) synthase